MYTWTITKIDGIRTREFGNEDEVVIREIYNPAKQESYRYSFEHSRKGQRIKTCGYADPNKSISFAMGADGRLSKIKIHDVKKNNSIVITLNHNTQTAKVKDKRANALVEIPSSEAMYFQLEGLAIPIDDASVMFLTMMFI